MSRRHVPYDAARHVPVEGWTRDDAFVTSRTGRPVPLPAGGHDDDGAREAEQERERLQRRFAERYAEVVSEIDEGAARLIELASAVAETSQDPDTKTGADVIAAATVAIDGNRNLLRRLRKELRTDEELVELARRLGCAA
jgi:hypothetical protein